MVCMRKCNFAVLLSLMKCASSMEILTLCHYLFVYVIVTLCPCFFQINGHDVQNREEAVALLSNENSRSIVLLVTRPEGQVRLVNIVPSLIPH